ncbi:hypothetical protein [Streptomyces longhuiensis]|uniref:hypothetical protein n=1 Tax=Streptomyces longhuiensis TaxID=2880933 RepID=UPI001D09ABED|nr:hypothetical protein [Streptomyces longhuiensis]UDM01272.1 hypothetical protein LGI35_24875 [Streptomyces longhuiensis]
MSGGVVVLAEGLIAVAAAGGGAIVQAAGTDAWAGIRSGVARILGRGEAGREQAELERLDQTQAELESAGDGTESERVQTVLVTRWQTRLEMLLEQLPDEERQQVAAELQTLVQQAQAQAPVQSTHNDFSNATFTDSQVLGSGTQNNTINR